MNFHFASLLICISCAAGCIQKLDDRLAADGALPRPVSEPAACGGAQGFACNFPVDTTTPDIGLKANDAGDVTDSTDPSGACAKVVQDTADILKRKCAGCHEGAPNVPGAPLTFIMDPTLLATTPSTSQKFTGQPYLMPGNPEGSLIYQRAVLIKDMPLQSPLSPPSYLTVSEASVLRQWISSCVDGASPSIGMTGAGGTGAGGTGDGAESGGGNGGSAAANGGGSAGVTAAGGVGGSAAGGVGGSAAAGAGGGGGRLQPCGGLCLNPTPFAVPGPFRSNALGAGAACYQTSSPLSAFSCSNAYDRTFSINGITVGCARPLSLATIPLRNGGYCVRATAGGNPAAFFSAY